MLGRFLSGIATSLLFSVFEAWMVKEHNSRGFHPDLLSDTFGKATLGNGVVAVLAGLIASFAADRFGYVAPFLVCLLPLFCVGVIVKRTWNENYGDQESGASASLGNAISVLSKGERIAQSPLCIAPYLSRVEYLTA